jgi:hypothetical protein
MSVSLQRLHTARNQSPVAVRLVLAHTVQDLHPASPLSPAQQAQFQACCARLVDSDPEASCPDLLLAADVCFNHAYQLGSPAARGCPRHP